MRSWGRWGDSDERGALNRLSAESMLRGIATVRAGVALSLGIPIAADGPVAGLRRPPQHFMTRDGGDYAAGLEERPGFGFADDYLLIACHGTTHLDALSHIWRDGLMWNGFPASSVTSRGASRCGIEKTGPIVTRAVFVDLVPDGEPGLPDGHEIALPELQAALARGQTWLTSGDALLVRTGWLNRWRLGEATTSVWPGLDGACGSWLDDQGVVLVGADNMAVECYPSSDPGCDTPLHVSLIRDSGVYLMELCDLEDLARTGRTEFLLIVSPLPIVGGVGSPVAPVAVL